MASLANIGNDGGRQRWPKQKSFLVIGDYKKIWNRAEIFFLVRPQ
jgi:hypothetical protein